MRLRALITVIGIAIAAAAAWSAIDKKETDKRLVDELEKLRTVHPLRREAAQTAKDILDFADEQERFNHQFSPGQRLSDVDAKRTLTHYREAVDQYHAHYERRVTRVAAEIEAVTHRDVSQLTESAHKASVVREIRDVANNLSALASTLP